MTVGHFRLIEFEINYNENDIQVAELRVTWLTVGDLGKSTGQPRDLKWHCDGKGKGTAILVHPWTGPEGSTRLRLPDFKTIGA
jgi:hypothetical protein